jgi:hypothetical protein
MERNHGKKMNREEAKTGSEADRKIKGQKNAGNDPVSESSGRPSVSCAPCVPSWLNLAGRFVLAAVFMVAGGLKIGDPIGFARNIVDYDLVPELFAPGIAVVLPWWEVGAAALALAGRWKLGALGMLAGMSAAFLVIGVVTLARGLTVECGCFGFLSERVGPVSVGIEAALAVMSVWVLKSEIRGQRSEVSGKTGTSNQYSVISGQKK